jgi:GT2 family glycosyltransferase
VASLMASAPLSFIIPVRNDADGLRRCLHAVAAAVDGLGCEIIVVDNGSTDSSTAVARQAGAIVISAPGVRVSAVRNKGASAAQGALLAFVDADNEICPGWASAALEATAAADVAAAGAPYRPPSPGTWVQRAFDALRRHPSEPEDTDWLASGNLVVRRTAFVEVDGFDETLETCEDVDFCRRLKRAGWRLMADSRLESVHHGDPGTLSAVFHSEWWRGRDNLRVSLRAPRAWRSLVSVGLSGSMVLATVTMAAGVALGHARSPVVGAAAATVVAVILARTMRIVHGLGSGPVVIGQALAVAAAYEAGRAMALVSRASHARRQARSR